MSDVCVVKLYKKADKLAKQSDMTLETDNEYEFSLRYKDGTVLCHSFFIGEILKFLEGFSSCLEFFIAD